MDGVTAITAAGLGASALLYARGAIALWRRRPQRLILLRGAAFAGGWLALAIALLSPLAAISEWLFSAHMTQHTLLMLVATPLAVAGQPIATMLSAGPRDSHAAGDLLRWGRPVWRALAAPGVAFVLLLFSLWIWHLPSLHEAALHSSVIHGAQHLMFVLASAAFWWGLVHGRYGRYGYGAGVAFVFLTAVHSSVLGALLTFASQVLYPTYAARGAAHAVDAQADQQIAGLIMWVPSGVIFIVIGVALFAAWLGEAERRARLGVVEDR